MVETIEIVKPVGSVSVPARTTNPNNYEEYPMGNSWLHHTRLALFVSLLLGLIMVGQARGTDDPDELYRQGRFAEAEKGYAQLDMDHPKVIRYRYNRGCAAYQNSDYQGAMAAFSSVLKRSTEDDVRFKTTYNLGNIAYKLGDFGSAVAYYKQAVSYNPASKDVRHNLELALRELKKQDDSSKDQGQHDSDQANGEQSRQKTEAGQTQSDKQTQKEKAPEEESSQDPAKKDSADSARQDGSEQGAAEQGGEKAGQERPTDLSGDLQSSQPMAEAAGDSSESAMAAIDRNKAEALLENIKEDRTKYLRFQVPPEKRGGIQSGKDW
jgi:Ca-activated chloride channel family protein